MAVTRSEDLQGDLQRIRTFRALYLDTYIFNIMCQSYEGHGTKVERN